MCGQTYFHTGAFVYHIQACVFCNKALMCEKLQTQVQSIVQIMAACGYGNTFAIGHGYHVYKGPFILSKNIIHNERLCPFYYSRHFT